ncbi:MULTISPECIES: glycoside hydrolase family 75 protein [unclassified Kutzneria]|uniref:glycoside hydrolase family 75 protein n=1 Tax=unclassified Kutzneria TaxID=2621979 RepID=UPI0003EEA940|nr:glycoside hydrolase family 75 protein [Kutzneria sp. 744]EWM17605.1 sugar hydrolase [Kutzneria sp. 744]
MAKLKYALAALIAAAVVLVPAQLTAQAATQAPAATQAAPKADGGSPTAAELLAKTANCKVVSKGTYTNTQANKKVNICGATGAFFWTSGMNIDCDGQRTTQCNENTDCCYQNDTSFHQSDGKPMNAAKTPYVVIPLPSSRFKYASNGIKGGDILAVVYKGQVEYAVFGDEGPNNIIGEASYATAQALGINPDPSNGGTADPVTYIVFPGSKSGKIEDHNATVTAGRKAAATFVSKN